MLKILDGCLTMTHTLLCNKLTPSSNFLIQSTSSIRDAIRQMDLNSIDNLILLSDDKVVGFFSSGDFRRLVYKGVNFDRQLADVIEKEFIYLSEDYTKSQANQKFKTYKYLKIIPILDSDGRFVKTLNREDYLEDSMHHDVQVPVVIMAGGLGSRLAPLTDVIPKPLVPIEGETVIKVIIDNFKVSGFHNFHISVNYQKEIIKAYLSYLPSNYSFKFIEEPKPMGTAGALNYFDIGNHDYFFVINCDTIVNVNCSAIYEQHVERGNDITIVASMKDYELPYGICTVNSNGSLHSIKEKPTESVLANTGMYVMSMEILELLPEGKKPVNMDFVIQKAKEQGYSIGVFPISNKAWQDVGQWKEYLDKVNES